MTKLKKFIAVFIAMIWISTSNIFVYADGNSNTENFTINEVGANTFSIIDPIIPLDINPPDNSETTLPYTAIPNELYAGCGSYTLYSFKTSTGNLNMHYELEAYRPDYGKRSMTLYIYKKVVTPILWWEDVSWRFVDGETVTINDTNSETFPPYKNKPYEGDVKFTNLSTTESYCLRIVNSTDPSEESDYTSILTKITITD